MNHNRYGSLISISLMTPTPSTSNSLPNSQGRFGPYGGKFVPETLMAALEELQTAFRSAQSDSSFSEELNSLLIHYAGRPTPLYFAQNLSRSIGGARIYLKREDLAHTPSISKVTRDRMIGDEEDDTFLKLVKDITSKGFVRSNYKDKLVDLSNVRINLKSKK